LASCCLGAHTILFGESTGMSNLGCDPLANRRQCTTFPSGSR
jgi:hypothetical protein